MPFIVSILISCLAIGPSFTHAIPMPENFPGNCCQTASFVQQAVVQPLLSSPGINRQTHTDITFGKVARTADILPASRDRRSAYPLIAPPVYSVGRPGHLLLARSNDEFPQLPAHRKPQFSEVSFEEVWSVLKADYPNDRAAFYEAHQTFEATVGYYRKKMEREQITDPEELRVRPIGETLNNWAALKVEPPAMTARRGPMLFGSPRLYERAYLHLTDLNRFDEAWDQVQKIRTHASMSNPALLAFDRITRPIVYLLMVKDGFGFKEIMQRSISRTVPEEPISIFKTFENVIDSYSKQHAESNKEFTPRARRFSKDVLAKPKHLWEAFIPRGRQKDAVWKKNRQYRGYRDAPFLQILEKPLIHHISDFLKIITTYGIPLDDVMKGTGLVIGVGRRIEELFHLPKTFRWVHTDVVEWVWKSVEAAARQVAEAGIDPETLTFHHASMEKMQEFIPTGSVAFLYASGITPPEKDREWGSEILRVLRPGGIVYMYLTGSLESAQALADSLSRQGRLLSFNGNQLVFLKTAA